LTPKELAHELSALSDKQFAEAYKVLEPIDKWRFYRIVTYMRSRRIGDWDTMYKKTMEVNIYA
jgi:hypothetical protein